MALRYEVGDGVAIITLARPDVLNALDDDLGRALLEAVTKASEDGDARCVVITGEGRAFSAGEDLGALASGYRQGRPADLGNTLTTRYNPLIRTIRSAPKPVVAALNGAAAGAGASIALACDFRVASERATLVLAFIKVGLVPDSGGLWFLSKLIGSARAWELAALGTPVDASTAFELGLVVEVHPEEEFERGWQAFAASLASGPTRAFALTKSLMNAASHTSLDEQLDLEMSAQSKAGATADHLEGVQAFLAKRAPRFGGS